MKELTELAGTIFFWSLVSIILFGFNPWSRLIDGIQQLRGKPPIFHKKLEPPKRRAGRLTTGKVYVATAVVDGNVVQEHIVAKSDEAAKNLAAERLRIEPEEVEVAEIIDKVVRR